MIELAFNYEINYDIENDIDNCLRKQFKLFIEEEIANRKYESHLMSGYIFYHTARLDALADKIRSHFERLKAELLKDDSSIKDATLKFSLNELSECNHIFSDEDGKKMVKVKL